MRLHIGGECFRPVIRVYSNSCILIFYFSTYVLYLCATCAIEIYGDDDDDDGDDNEVQHLHGQSSFHI